MPERNLFYEQLEQESEGDYVEVVRCGDCKSWQRDWKPKIFKSKRYCVMLNLYTTAKWFCPWGERRTE